MVPANVWGGNSVPVFSTDEIKRMHIMLGRRYNRSTNVLNLSSIAMDPDLGTVYSRNKAGFFSELMQIWQNSNEATPNVIDLSNNVFTNLDTISTFSQTFPDLKYLNLAHNSFMTAEALSPWGWELRELKEIDLRGNPCVIRSPTWRDDILRLYLKLTHLNGVEVRTVDDLRTAQERAIPIRPLAPMSQANSNADGFMHRFFPLYDSDRSSLAGQYYGADSTFSIVIDQRGRLAPGYAPATWENYSRKQNIIKFSFSPPPRRLEAITGPQMIRECWNALPRTLHPDVASELFKYKYEEEEYIPEGEARAYIILIQGEFREFTSPIGNIPVLRSFDRTFIVEPVQSSYEFRIVSDILVISPYAGDIGNLATNSKPVSYEQTMISPYMTPAKNYAINLNIPRGFGERRVGKPEEEVKRETLVLDLSRRKKMSLKGSVDVLHRCSWLFADAITYVEQKRVTIRHS